MPIIRSVRLEITACGVVYCCSGGLVVRRAAANPPLQRQHRTTCCNLQSYAPDDGQSFVRNIELILKINKHCYLLHLVSFDFIE
jgi:hypothetical protein